MILSVLLLKFLLLCLNFTLGKQIKNFKVSPEITTGWTFCRNQALYASEFLYEQDRDSFWTFFKELNQKQNIKSAGKSSNKDQEFILSLLKRTGNGALLKLNLEMETFAPKIESKSKTEKLPEDCDDLFIEYKSGVYVCSIKELEDKELLGIQPTEYDFLKEVSNPDRPIIRIYTIAGSKDFNETFEHLIKNDFNVAVRLISKPKNCPFYQEEVRPTGYGLEFEIKSSKYVVEEADQEDQEDIEDGKSVYDSLGTLKAFKDIDQVQDIQSKALKKLRKSRYFLDILNISTNIPLNYDKYKSSKAIEQDEEEYEIQFRINDLDLKSANLDPFGLLDFMNVYAKISGEMSKIISKADKNIMKKLLHSRVEFSSPKSTCIRYELVGKSLTYLNDLQSDNRYSDWPKSFNSKIQLEEGQFYGRNVLTVVFPVDFDAKESPQILESLVQMISLNYPIRFAIIPVIKSLDGNINKSNNWIKAYFAVREQYGMRISTGFLRNAIKMYQSAAAISENESEDPLQLLLEDLHLKIDSKFTKNDLFEESFLICKRFQMSSSQEIFANGRVLQITQDLPEKLISIYKQELDLILTEKDLKKTKKDLYISLLKRFKANKSRITDLDQIKYEKDLTFDDIKTLLSITNYVKSEKQNEKLSIWISSEFDRIESFLMVINLLKIIVKSDSLRLRIFVTNPMTSMPNRIILASSAVLVDCSSKQQTQIIEFLELFYKNYFGPQNQDISLQDLQTDHAKEDILKRLMRLATSLNDPILKQIQRENENLYKIYAEVDFEKFILLSLNGNLFKFGDQGKMFDLEGLILMELEGNANRFFGIENSSKNILTFSIFESQLLSKLNESLSYLISPSKTSFPEDEHTIEIGNEKTSVFNVEAIFNPYNREGQKFASIMSYFAGSELFYFKLILIPDPTFNDNPKEIKIYRFVTPETKGAPIPIAQVTDTESLLAMSLDLPPAWMTVSTFSNADLDNIRPIKVPHLYASFRLSNILIEGQVTIEEDESVATGKIVQIYNHETGLIQDETLVMANYGYYQLKASPGRWNLRVIESQVEYPILKGAFVQLSSFSGSFNRLSISSQGFSIKSDISVSKPQADLNVFSLASGLVYERLLRIMILSVMKQIDEESSVKFWLLETSLSAQGILALEGLSKEYNFEYELIAFKWPTWLNPQTKKHRTIWAYKILFLDVLFPQNLNKIVYIDADVVLRSDLRELVDLDLKGHVYAMVPYCEDKEEMAPFRFWEFDYWKNHLKGRSYHMSALFVVDLKELRRQSVADIIRAEYHLLSRDPNSLANLDQDVLNNLQNYIPIYSLPQEWLWCDTWCPLATNTKAKSINLCNNPKIFESKLDHAVRIVPEWKSFDEEIKIVLERTKIEYQENLKSFNQFNDHMEL